MRTFTHPGDPALSLPPAALAGWVGRTTLAALDPLVWGVGWPEGPRRIFPGGPEMPTPNPLPPTPGPTSPRRPPQPLSASPAHLGVTPVRPAKLATNALSISWVCLFYCKCLRGLKHRECGQTSRKSRGVVRAGAVAVSGRDRRLAAADQTLERVWVSDCLPGPTAL